MPDIMSKRQRSLCMASIRSTANRSTEVRLAQILRNAKIHGWRRRIKLPGQPDFVFLHSKVAIFVDGCFWHGCPSHAQIPRQNAAYWRPKLERNQGRDR